MGQAESLSSNLVSRDNSEVPILQLPVEIIHQILCNLQCQALVCVSQTCRRLQRFAQEEILWANLLRQTIPERDFPTTSFPSASYRDLYITHHPYWFLPRHKIWFSDEPHVGRIMIIRYDPRRGAIEGYRLLADRSHVDGSVWSHNPNVHIHPFQPRLHLWLDEPILKLPHDNVPLHTKQGWWEKEIQMSVGAEGHPMPASFFLGRNIPERWQDPRMKLWPPRTIPDMPRVRADSQDKFRGKGHKPQTYDEISQTTFRLRHWSQFSIGMAHFGIRTSEEVSTWSTLDPSLYTPTPDKPFQGLYVGDYASHGCEFLLVIQTERAPPGRGSVANNSYFREMLGLHDENDSDYEDLDEGLYNRYARDHPETEEDPQWRGAIEAIKLTGDANIPRGEHTFIADDIGPKGLLRVADEEPFRGARVVRSRGHVAARGFQRDDWIPSQLLLIDHDRMAQFWVPFGHISYYRRVDINKLLEETFSPRRSAALESSYLFGRRAPVV